MQSSAIVLFPPLLVLIVAFMVRRLNPALIIGIISATIIASDFSLVPTLQLTCMRLISQLMDPDYLYLYGFLFTIGTLIVLLSKTGGATAFAHAITKHLRSKRSVETSSLLLSSILFIDDYLSSLTVGYVMRPLTDKFSIPRAKLAFLVHSLSGPLVILAPISSWVAMITSQLDLAGINSQDTTARINADPFFIYLYSIPFIFYSILLIISVWFIVRKQISFGPMHTQELIAKNDGNLFGGKAQLVQTLEHEENPRASVWDLLFPLLLLITTSFSAILYVGGFWFFGGHNSLITALKNNKQTFFALFIAGIITLVSSIVFAFLRKSITIAGMKRIFADGIQLMYSAVVMVFLASTFGLILKLDLQVGSYVAQTFIGALAPAFLPAMFFIISLMVATLTGSSWGTIAIMLPGTIQMLSMVLNLPLGTAPEHIAILFPVLGAIFSGAVCGDHISPISETTIMAATSSGSYPLDHAYTQFFYALPAILASVLAFLVAGTLASYGTFTMLFAALSVGISSCLLALHWLNRKS